MKKRSLVAAVAMLIVSAIVLTSSTYAWFVVGNAAKVTSIGAQISTAASGIELRDYGNTLDWSSELAWATINSLSATVSKPATYIPATAYVDTSGTVGAFSCVKGAYHATESNKIQTKTAGVAGTDYATITFRVRRADSDGTVYLRPEITSAASSSNANKAFKMAIEYHKDNTGTGNLGVLGVWSDADYNAIKTLNKTFVDDGDHYIDATENTAAYASDLAAVSSTKTFGTDYVALSEVNTGGTSYVVVYIWLEGNDPDCTNALSNLATTFDIKLSDSTTFS